jgi:hypothetical protein
VKEKTDRRTNGRTRTCCMTITGWVWVLGHTKRKRESRRESGLCAREKLSLCGVGKKNRTESRSTRNTLRRSLPQTRLNSKEHITGRDNGSRRKVHSQAAGHGLFFITNQPTMAWAPARNTLNSQLTPLHDLMTQQIESTICTRWPPSATSRPYFTIARAESTSTHRTP